jgi:hypothetical protein
MIAPVPGPLTRKMTILAQDPSVRLPNRRILTAEVPVAFEELADGPIGHRVQVVDYDASTRTLYRPAKAFAGDFPAPSSNAAILEDPAFHAYNVYALVMRTLARFEQALGRRVSWCFDAHQLKVVPHAFEEANAFYSREAESLLFGYYRNPKGRRVFTCLSQDIVVHETAHALLDGLRSRFMAPSSPDQAAFHEAFADVVALLSVFSLGSVLGHLIDRAPRDDRVPAGLIEKSKVTAARLKRGVLLGLADEMATDLARVNALRRSVLLRPRDASGPEFEEPHRRGEILVAAVMQAFVDAWTARLRSPDTADGPYVAIDRVVEEGAAIADALLTMAIRALDYTPPIHIDFADYLSALLTADTEVRPSDGRFELRKRLVASFARYGIAPASKTADGLWKSAELALVNEGVRFGSLQTDRIEMFRLIWRNRDLLHIDPTVYTRVASLRPCIRTSPDDGLPLRETVAECLQYVQLPASELNDYGLRKPPAMPDSLPVTLEGGLTLVLDEYGQLKYEVYQRLPSERLDTTHAQERLEYLWENGFLRAKPSVAARLADMHRLRAGVGAARSAEAW